MGCAHSASCVDVDPFREPERLPVKAHLRAAPMCQPICQPEGPSCGPAQSTLVEGQHDCVLLHSGTGTHFVDGLLSELRSKHGLRVWCPTESAVQGAGAFARVSSGTALGEIHPLAEGRRPNNALDINAHQVASILPTTTLGLVVLVTAGSTWDEGVVACLRSSACKDRPLVLLHAPESCPAPNVSDWPADVRQLLLSRHCRALTYISSYKEFGAAQVVAELRQWRQPQQTRAEGPEQCEADHGRAPVDDSCAAADEQCSGAPTAASPAQDGLQEKQDALLQPWKQMLVQLGRLKLIEEVAMGKAGQEALADMPSVEGHIPAGMLAGSRTPGVVLAVHHPAMMPCALATASALSQHLSVVIIDGCRSTPLRPAGMRRTLHELEGADVLPGPYTVQVKLDHSGVPAMKVQDAAQTAGDAGGSGASSGNASPAAPVAHLTQVLPVRKGDTKPQSYEAVHHGSVMLELSPLPDAALPATALPVAQGIGAVSQLPTGMPLGNGAASHGPTGMLQGECVVSQLPAASKHSRSMSMGAGSFAAQAFQQHQRHHAMRALGRMEASNGGVALPSVPPCAILRTCSTEAVEVVSQCLAYVLFTGYNLGTASHQAGAEVSIALQAGASLHLVCEASFNLLRPDTRNWGLTPAHMDELSHAWLQRVLYYPDHLDAYLTELSRRLIGLGPADITASLTSHPSAAKSLSKRLSSQPPAPLPSPSAESATSRWVTDHAAVAPPLKSPLRRSLPLLNRAGSLPAALGATHLDAVAGLPLELIAAAAEGGQRRNQRAAGSAVSRSQPAPLAGLNAVSCEDARTLGAACEPPAPPARNSITSFASVPAPGSAGRRLQVISSHHMQLASVGASAVTASASSTEALDTSSSSSTGPQAGTPKAADMVNAQTQSCVSAR